ncbi:Protein DJ-1 B, variant 2 [Stylosanthes scabra]|uniref:Protein DJ-1 B, variant 2 n=2 Tax=Stylosanthes scabra TaxID=79078 RepID=A0ABU6SFQ7_9FABA|nr:Protein DJ-1 B, variant 2 [Stylosanthes scabra]
MALRHLRLLPHPLANTFTPKPSQTLRKNRVCFSLSTSPIMATTSRKVLVPIANGTEPMEAVITIDVLRRSGADVTVASAGNHLTVQALHGVKIVADAVVSDVADATFDLVALPGGVPGVDNLRECGVLEKLVKKHVEDGRLYAAVCAAPAAVLGPWGLLKGVKATCHPAFMEKLASYTTTVESRVQLDGKVVTSRAPGTTMEFGVALVEQLYGKQKADEVAGPLVMRSNHADEYVFAELNSVQWTTENPPKVLVPIANGSEEMEAVIIIDILRRAKANVVVASLEDKLEIVASRNDKLEADMLLDEAAKLSYDLIVLPGGLGGAQTFAKSETLVGLLKKQRENKYYGAICASPALVLEPHGLLKGKKATAFPALCNKLSDPSEAENRVIVDGNLVTSRGPGTSIEFALAIVEKLFGRKLGLEIAKAIVFSSP